MLGTAGTIYFFACALVAVLGAVATVAARNPIRGAMGLMVTIIALAGLFLQLSAQFLAAIQLIVYAGAVVVLFLFIIMLLGPDATSPRDGRGLFPRLLGAGLFAITAASAGGLLLASPGAAGTLLPALPRSFGTTGGIGRELFTTGLVPFELSSALLMVAVIGAIAVARGKQTPPGQKG